MAVATRLLHLGEHPYELESVTVGEHLEGELPKRTAGLTAGRDYK